MRTRFAALLLSALLAVTVGCSKKEQTQAPQTDQNAQQQQPAGQNTTAQNTPPANTSPSAMAPAPTAPAEVKKEEPPPPPPPLVVPAGTSLLVRLGSTIDTKTAQPGQGFTGTLARAVAVGGEVAIPSGSGVSGEVVESKSPGKFKGEGVLAIRVTHLDVKGVPYDVATSEYVQTVKGKGKRTAVAVGGGTGAGALIGGLAGGGKGAAIGALVGAGAGTAGAAFTGNKELSIPAESTITFRLAESLTVKHTGIKAGKSQAAEQDAAQQ